MIDVQAVINKFGGQSLSYDGIPANRGQCVQPIEFILTDRQVGYGLAPFWGNAIDWWNSFSGVLAANFDRIPISQDKPKAGDFVVYNSGVGSIYGHIDFCIQDGNASGFVAYDSNWGKDLTFHRVQHNYNAVIGSLRRKGQVVDDMVKPSEADVYSGFRQFLGKEPANPAEVQFYLDRDIRDFYHEILFSGLLPKLEEVQQAFKDLSPDTPIDTPPNPNQSSYYTQHPRDWLYKDLAYYSVLPKAKALAGRVALLDPQVTTLTSENTTLKQKLTEADNQIKDPNKIIITQKGFAALWVAIQSFFSKNN